MIYRIIVLYMTVIVRQRFRNVCSSVGCLELNCSCKSFLQSRVLLLKLRWGKLSQTAGYKAMLSVCLLLYHNCIQQMVALLFTRQTFPGNTKGAAGVCKCESFHNVCSPYFNGNNSQNNWLYFIKPHRALCQFNVILLCGNTTEAMLTSLCGTGRALPPLVLFSTLGSLPLCHSWVIFC